MTHNFEMLLAYAVTFACLVATISTTDLSAKFEALLSIIAWFCLGSVFWFLFQMAIA